MEQSRQSVVASAGLRIGGDSARNSTRAEVGRVVAGLSARSVSVRQSERAAGAGICLRHSFRRRVGPDVPVDRQARSLGTDSADPFREHIRHAAADARRGVRGAADERREHCRRHQPAAHLRRRAGSDRHSRRRCNLQRSGASGVRRSATALHAWTDASWPSAFMSWARADR